MLKFFILFVGLYFGSKYVNNQQAFDLIVIGGGSGGLACAKEAADLGKKVVVVDYTTPSPNGATWGIGGTCENVGSIPFRIFRFALELIELVTTEVAAYGVSVPMSLPFNTIMGLLKPFLSVLTQDDQQDLSKRGITYINGKGAFVNPTTIQVVQNGTTTQLTASNIVIATGTRPKYPNIPGAQSAITTDDLYQSSSSPMLTLIIGCNQIAIETASFLQELGNTVTMFCETTPLPTNDQQMVGLIYNAMVQKGVTFKNYTNATSISGAIGTYTVNYVSPSGSGSSTFTTVIMAIGRVANLTSLNIAAAGITTDADGFLPVSSGLQTNVANIYAVGDICAGQPLMTNLAVKGGFFIARNLFAGESNKIDLKNIPNAIRTTLEYGYVDLPEENLTATVGPTGFDAYVAKCRRTSLTLTSPEKNGTCFLKALVSGGNVKGMHIIAPNAAEIIQGYASAMKMGLTWDVLRNTIGIHPTISAEFTKLNITKASKLPLRDVHGGCN